MSKELTPLQALEHFRNQQIGVNVYADEYSDIIEQALKKLEKIETTTHSVLRDDISKKLKALEIIKNLPNEDKQVLLNAIYSYTKSEEKYDLLKEVLLWVIK